MSPISALKQVDNTDQEISDDESQDHGEPTLSSDIEEEDLDRQQVVLLPGQACWDKTIRTT